ncbi:NfeD family protein [Castellaniella sp.]|jgi:membrane-bound serine protease (ClpP class)|uniref:NfeD family protein n=1 Tax=Castellaniella sp. TaxID=1955812 RepID=UPI003A8D2B4C
MLLLYFGTQSVWALILLGLVIVLAAVIGIQAHRSRALGGNEELLGMLGEVTDQPDARGTSRVLVRGEIWQARSDTAISPGQTIRVKHVRGLVLTVEPMPSGDKISGESS